MKVNRRFMRKAREKRLLLEMAIRRSTTSTAGTFDIGYRQLWCVTVPTLSLPVGLLDVAFANTVQLLESNVKVKE